MSNRDAPESRNLSGAQLGGEILLSEESIQFHLYGEDELVDRLLEALHSYGVLTEEEFRSPCG